MPRKQNGFGSTKSFKAKAINHRTDLGKGVGAAGTYPSNRRYGSSVHRSVIEKYNLDSDWVKWRKGYEYYNQAVWYRLQDLDEFSGEYKDSQIQSVLYQGTPYQIDVVFDGFKFATHNADSNNHYVMKRTTTSKADIGVITGVNNDPQIYATNKANREIWTKIFPGKDGALLRQMVGERITDGETEATLSWVLTEKSRPSVYVGKTFDTPTEVTVTMNKRQIFGSIQNPQDLVGKIVYIKNFYVEQSISDFAEFEYVDGRDFWQVNATDVKAGVELTVLDPGVNALPPSLYDITTLPEIISSTTAGYSITGSYIYKKDLYQRFYGKEYLVADTIDNECDQASYAVMPFKILGVVDDGSFLTLKSVPFQAELKLYAKDILGYLVFPDYSFTKLSIDEYDGEYYHQLGAPGEGLWTRLDTDVDPWMDEVFAQQNPLEPATIYTCSCPNHAHAILSAPQATQDEGTRAINRQRRYPLPTVLGEADFEALGRNTAAGKMESWESREHRMGFKMCKHSIAAMFIDRIKVQEPNKYPTFESRQAFEEKLVAEIAEVADEFNVSYKRGGITTLEVVFALAQGLNLDDVETAYVILNSNF